MLSVRDAFFYSIYEQIKKGEDYYIITADLGAPSLDDLRKYYPDRYISVGIAEQSLIAISAGLAMAGHKVIAYGLNPFPVTRAYDQIKSVIAGMNIPITICGLNAGLCSAEAGYTHVPVEDFCMMRLLPNIEMYNPTDCTLAKLLGDTTGCMEYPRFIRFDKKLGEKIYEKDDINLSRGFAVFGNNRAKVSIITLGIFVADMRRLADKYKNQIKVIDIFKMKPNEEKLAEEIAESKEILTVEENMLQGGIGSFLLEMLSDRKIIIPVSRIGVRLMPYNVFTNRDYIQKDQQLDIEHIEKVIQKLI